MRATSGQAVILWLFSALSVFAQETRLDALLAQLADPDVAEPARLAAEIDALWAQSGSDSMDLLLQRGRAAMESQEVDKALAHLSALTGFAPEFAEGWNSRATAYFLAEDYWASVTDIQRALTLEPRHFGALSGLGIILERTGDESGALAAYRAALKVNPHLDELRQSERRLAAKLDGRDI